MRGKNDLREHFRELTLLEGIICDFREFLRELVHFPSIVFFIYNMIGIFLRCQKTDLGENAEEEISLPVSRFSVHVERYHFHRRIKKSHFPYSLPLSGISALVEIY